MSAGPGARQLAELFHDRYERLAPSFGYVTRKETRAFDPTSTNGRLMIAVCDEILTWFDREDGILERLREDYERTVFANAEIAAINIDQAAIIERLRAALRGVGQWLHSEEGASLPQPLLDQLNTALGL